MKFQKDLRVYGDPAYRGDCPTESVEQITLFRRIRDQWPDTLGVIAIHPRNEGARHYGQTARQKAEGLTIGAADLIIPGAPTLVIEIKRRDHTKSKWETGQREYLAAARARGAFVGVALGADAAMIAVAEWIMISD